MYKGKSEFELELIEEKEEHLNIMVSEYYHKMEQEARTGVEPHSAVCALVNMAKELAKDYENIVGPRYFQNCAIDVLAGGDGLHVKGK